MATASFSSSSLLLTLALSSLLFSCSAQIPGCKSQTFTNQRTFSNCYDLPYLNSTLHWTFDSKTSNLTLAFTAKPAKTGGWVAWGINPEERKMAGTQALLAYPGAGGAVVTKTFNITAELALLEGKISYDVYDLTAEMSGDGKISIFATVTLLPNITTINLVWQVGPGVDGGRPLPHAMNMENMMSTGVLDLEGGGGAPVSPPTVAPSPGTGGGVPIPPPVEAPSPTHSGGGVPVPPPVGAPSPTPGGGGVPVPPPVGAPSPTHSGGGVPVPPPVRTPSPTPGGGGVPVPPPVGAPSPTHSGGGVPVPPPAQSSSPTPGGGGVPVPPSVGGGGVSPPPQAGAPSQIGGNSGNKISHKNGSVILCLFFMLLFSST